MSSEELHRYIYFLTQVNKLGNVKIRNILNQFRSPEDLFKSTINELKGIAGIEANISLAILRSVKDKDRIFKEFDEIYKKACKYNFKLISILDKDYPENLKRIYDSPVLLYYKGRFSDKDKYSLSIVGTRNPTEYGKYNCEKFTEQISSLNIPVISGFARGIDTIVHKTCLKNSNINYAVFGCGVDV
ncbi:MAG TPA: DNA-processing protein DprA, partial [Ignavibacteria bacterium]|nr:DNA-processing protein DprA [Ignavibacteria bacterium]